MRTDPPNDLVTPRGVHEHTPEEVDERVQATRETIEASAAQSEAYQHLAALEQRLAGIIGKLRPVLEVVARQRAEIQHDDGQYGDDIRYPSIGRGIRLRGQLLDLHGTIDHNLGTLEALKAQTTVP